MNRQPTIGVLSPLVGGFYFGGVMSGINKAARASGGTVIAIQTFDAGLEHTDYQEPPSFAHRLAWDRVDGFIILVDAIAPADLLSLTASDKPLVMVSGTGVAGCPSVAPDNAGGIEQAVDHLVRHGHSRIGFVGCLAQSDMRERFDAYQGALRRHGISAGGWQHELDDSYEIGGREGARALLDAGLPTTAVIAATDRNALGLMQVLREAGIELPREQAVIGFDDTEAGQHATPRLTSVRQDFRDVGEAAAGLLLRQLRGEPVEMALNRVPTSLARRQSCGCGQLDRSEQPGVAPVGRHAARADLDRSLEAAVNGGAADSQPRQAALQRAADVIEAEIAAALGGRGGIAPVTVQTALHDIYQLKPSVDTVEAVGAALRSYAGSTYAPADTAGALRLRDVTHSLAAAMRDAQYREKYQENTYFREAFNTQYTVSMALLTERYGQEHVLDWLGHTDVSAGALAIWDEAKFGLSLVSLFDAQGGADTGVGVGVGTKIEQFPPEVLITAARNHGDHIVLVVPVRQGVSDWGWLSVVGPIEDKAYIGRESISQWAALLSVALDVSAKRREVSELGRELSGILESSPDAIARYDSQLRYRYINRAAAASLGVDSDQIIGCTDGDLGRQAQLTDQWTEALKQVVSSVADTELEFSETKGEDTRWYQARMVPLVDADGLVVGVLSSNRDISDLKRAELSLAHQALHDALTGLANRVLFLDRLALAVARLERLPGTLAVLFIDLDHFKEINDSLGHEVGDKLLIQVAQRLHKLSRRSDTLARFGGDEFVLLCDRLAEDEDVRVIGDRLVRTLAEPFHEGEHELVVSASIGIVVIEDAGVDVTTVIRHADQAMYRAKARGRDRFYVYDPELRGRASARHSLEVDLRHALDRREFQLVYQPLFALDSGAVLGVEALLRWHHPTRGVVAPDDFIGLAEQRGLIVPIGAWVLDEALRQLAEWSERDDLGALGMAINISGRQLAEPTLVQTVQEALNRHRIEPGRVTLEITETTLIEQGGGIRETLAAISRLGVMLALDDFGTGYSSLVHLRDFPVNSLKIDRSFVDQLGTGTRAREIIGALTAMAHFLGMIVVGEGIEKQAQWDILRELGCDDGQGYLVSRPLPPAGVLRLIQELAAADPRL